MDNEQTVQIEEQHTAIPVENETGDIQTTDDAGNPEDDQLEYSEPGKFKKLLRSWQFWVGIFAFLVSIGFSVWLLLGSKNDIEALSQYGYLGAFVVSVLGGAVSLVPVPMAVVQFVLGPVAEPWFGPKILAPVFIGIVSGIGEGLGCLVTYFTGKTGGMALNAAKKNNDKPQSKIKKYTNIIIGYMFKYDSWVLFLLSATMNPFYYPVALTCGAMNYDIKRFFLFSTVGKIIKCAFIAYCGYFGLTWILR